MKIYGFINVRFNHHTKEYECDINSIELFKSKQNRDATRDTNEKTLHGEWINFEKEINE